MVLTQQQCEAAEHGRAIPVALPGSVTEFVIVRRDLAARFIPEVDYSPCDPDELLLLVAESLDPDEDWSMPPNHPYSPVHP